MIFILQLFFIFLLCFNWRRGNGCYKILVMFQMISFLAAPLIGNFVMFETPMTCFNVLFCFLNLYLIIAPWRRAQFITLQLEDIGFFYYYKKILYLVLGCTIIVNLIVLIIVYSCISDSAVFKAELGFHKLYDSIPYFGILFRYTHVSRYLGFLAFPICAYYIKTQNFKQAAKAFLMSSSSFIAALAFYSRAQLFSFIIVSVCLYFYMEHIFDDTIRKNARKILAWGMVTVAVILAGITFSRFSSSVMSYYGNRIPDNSYIKSPSLYSVFSYVSQGFPNGIMQLELHESKDVLEGEPLVYDYLMALSYFHLTSWTKEEYHQRLVDAYNKDGLNEWNNLTSFHGYTCRMVKTIGYICTLLFDLLYYRYVRSKSCSKAIDITSLSILVFLLNVSINSIFYNDYQAALYPLLFYIMISMPYNIIHRRKIIKVQLKAS